MYKVLIQPFLFLFDPEKVHKFTFFIIRLLHKFPLIPSIIRVIYQTKSISLEREVMGLKFKNPIGLAAGFDKNATLFNELSSFGFGHIEIGTLTPKAQPGNPKKRLFRLQKDQGIINRMGFNNNGVLEAVKHLKNRHRNLIIGGNIGKNKQTPNSEAFQDYRKCLEALHPYVDYFVINVSSPNTPNLRELQNKSSLEVLLSGLQQINLSKSNPRPILLKISPDLTNEQLLEIVEVVKSTKIAGVIATNTTISRSDLKSANASEQGGLSGTPLKNRSTEVIRFLAQHGQKSFVIIGLGGIFTVEDALEKLEAGADLIQLYTGFIYQGPQLIRKINKKLIQRGIMTS